MYFYFKLSTYYIAQILCQWCDAELLDLDVFHPIISWTPITTPPPHKTLTLTCSMVTSNCELETGNKKIVILARIKCMDC